MERYEYEPMQLGTFAAGATNVLPCIGRAVQLMCGHNIRGADVNPGAAAASNLGDLELSDERTRRIAVIATTALGGLRTCKVRFKCTQCELEDLRPRASR